jgi:hypothetical protein
LPCGDLAVLVPIVVYRQYPGASAQICKLQVYHARQARQGLMSQVLCLEEDDSRLASTLVDHPRRSVRRRRRCRRSRPGRQRCSRCPATGSDRGPEASALELLILARQGRQSSTTTSAQHTRAIWDSSKCSQYSRKRSRRSSYPRGQ